MDYLSLCLICKNENDYLAEWLDYHILMGVERFYIYDNESQVSVRQTLQAYIEKGWAVVLDMPGKAVQLQAYDHCLQTFGAHTTWLGFIDTDEFLVPRTTLDLKELLKAYEAWGGLAVSSLFFGSNGQQTRPASGQIAAYTTRTHETFFENQLIKSIVRPAQVLMPNTPHDFFYANGAVCVNEKLLRVDFQRFPNAIEKIQLNHYFCRSQAEIDQKLQRGRGDEGAAWKRNRFNWVNQHASYEDRAIQDNIDRLALAHGLAGLPWLEKLARLAGQVQPAPPPLAPPPAVTFRPEFTALLAIKNQITQAEAQQDFERIKNLDLALLKLLPNRISLYTDLSVVFLRLQDPQSAWQILAQAWNLAPNSQFVLSYMTDYFITVRNYEMALKTAHLLRDLEPHSLQAMGFMTAALLGLGRHAEALKIGVPLVQLSARVGELPGSMGVQLVKRMAEICLSQGDAATAALLWQAGLESQPNDVAMLLELAQALRLQGDKSQARQRLLQAQQIDPHNPAVRQALGRGQNRRR